MNRDKRGNFRPYHEYQELSPAQMLERAQALRQSLNRRRSVRSFSTRPVPRQLIEECIMAASSAPSGANRQPWQFVVISDAHTKAKVRNAAEAEEHRFYEDRAPQAWLDDLEPLGTDANKPFLEDAPYLIAIFGQQWTLDATGQKHKNYYINESVGIATGMLIAALHEAGLVSLTHTPAPMGFLREVLGRPDTERPFLLLVVGYPADDVEVPDISRKPLRDVATFIEPQTNS